PRSLLVTDRIWSRTMTPPNLPPDAPRDQELGAIAAWLIDHFGLPPERDTAPRDSERAAIRQRVLHASSQPPAPARASRATGIAAGIPMDTSPGSTGTPRHLAGLAAAAVLVLIALAMLGTVLRAGDRGDQQGGVAATASLLPFAAGTALASPTPVAGCATSDTLLLMPEEPVAPGDFAALPFPVAWYRDGTITVQRGGEVLREIDIGA